jgi:GGDEF domain-containing protein
MIEELLLTSQARHQKSVKQGDIISQPAQVDVTFKDFGSETDFLEEIAFLLNEIQEESNAGRRLEETLSIISLDIDKQSSIALTYGNRTARSLSQHVGERIKGVLRISDRYNQGKLFHISTDRYFLVLKMSLEEAQGLSVLLKSKLEGRYRVPYGNNMPGRPVLPENMQEIEEVTFHIGVGAYPFEKLNELLHRYPPEIAVRNAQLLIMSGIEEELALGAKEGGNCIITWDPQIWSHRLLK